MKAGINFCARRAISSKRRPPWFTLKTSGQLIALLLRNVLTASLIFGAASAQAVQIQDVRVDQIAEESIRLFNIPGIAIGIVKDGRAIYAKGFGVASINTNQKVNEETLFGVASNTKAFTAAAVGVLVDQGKIKWDDKVTGFIPEFKMSDPYITKEFTIRDLLTHRSGLRPGAGDLLHDPDSANFTIADIINGMQYLKAVSSFRTKFSYSNNFYIIAGEIISRVSNMSYERFITDKILTPLQMKNSAASYHGISNKSNVIDAHVLVKGSVRVVARYSSEIADPAGGIYSNVAEMNKWVAMQLDGGAYGDHQRLFSSSAQNEMWRPQTILDAGKDTIYHRHFAAYGLGWFMVDVMGYKEIFHSGQDIGMVSQVILVPELKLGITILANQEKANTGAIGQQILDLFIGVPQADHIKRSAAIIAASEADRSNKLEDIRDEANRQTNNADQSQLVLYQGLYRDKWFGDVQIIMVNKKLMFKAKRSPQLRGELHWYKDRMFVIRWVNSLEDSDAFVTFEPDDKIHPETMKIASVLKTGFDFSDLSFEKVSLR